MDGPTGQTREAGWGATRDGPRRHAARGQGCACQVCGAALSLSLIDLGYAPLASAFSPAGPDDRPQTRYRLHARVCQSCWLVQTDPVLTPRELFPPDLACLSSFSDTRRAEAQSLAGEMVGVLGLNAGDLVVEIGSNDGYLLRWFRAAGMAVLGIDPSARAGLAAAVAGVPTLTEFFGEGTGNRLGARLAREGRSPRFVAALNVLTRVPDLVGVLRGVAALLPPDGVFLAEVPHLQSVLEGGRFDLIRHDHFTCLSLTALDTAAARAGLRIVEAGLRGPQGATLRIVAVPAGSGRAAEQSVADLLDGEVAAGLTQAATYAAFAPRAEAVRAGLIEFLTLAQECGQRVAAYGASARGSALLNYCAIGPDLIAACADVNPVKQGTRLPGSGIPVVPPRALAEMRPDFVLILPWNLTDEILAQCAPLRAAGTRFVTAAPALAIIA